MVKALKVFKFILSLPFKTMMSTTLLGVGVALGAFGPQIWDAGTEAVAMFQDSGDAAFDPDVLLNPEKELEMIHSIRSDVQPDFKRAQILLRKQRAEIEYLREKCRFIVERVPTNQAEGKTSFEVLSELAERVSTDDEATKDDRELFETYGGPAWMAMQTRSKALEQSLGELLNLQARVEFLQGKGYFAAGLEELELEDLPGISGLRALRVTIASKGGTGEEAPPARPSASEIETVLTGDQA